MNEFVEKIKSEVWNKAYELAPGEWCENHRANLSQDFLIEEIVKACIKELETTQVCDSYTGRLIDCDYNDALAEGIANIKEIFGVNDE